MQITAAYILWTMLFWLYNKLRDRYITEESLSIPKKTMQKFKYPLIKDLIKALYINFCFKFRIAFLALNLLKQRNYYLSDLFKIIEATIIPSKTKADKGRAINSKPKLSFFVPDEKSWKEPGIKADFIDFIQASGRISMFEIDLRVSVKRMKIEGKEKLSRGRWVIIWRVFINSHNCFSENPRTRERITLIATLPDMAAPAFFVIASKFLIKAID